jgi:hypothetical protein
MIGSRSADRHDLVVVPVQDEGRNFGDLVRSAVKFVSAKSLMQSITSPLDRGEPLGRPGSTEDITPRDYQNYAIRGIRGIHGDSRSSATQRSFIAIIFNSLGMAEDLLSLG